MNTEVLFSFDEVREKVLKFLTKYIRKDGLGHDDNFFAKGMVNSLFAMQLVLFIEKEFHFKVQNEDLDLKNFCSINAISNFINNKLGKKPSM